MAGSALAEHLVSAALSYRMDDPAWDDFLARLAVTVVSPACEFAAATAPEPPSPAEPIDLGAELRAMGLM